MSPVVKGTHSILETQTMDMKEHQRKKDELEYAARVREGKAWLVDDEVYDQKMKDMGILACSGNNQHVGRKIVV